MHLIPQQFNISTQIVREHTIFNNWQVVAKAWYIALKSSELLKGQAKACMIGRQRIAFFRGETGKVYAVDSFCPHMGVDLSLGTVVGENIRCLFHHWQFNGQGECIHIPCGEAKPSTVHLEHYMVVEKYGYIWIWPESTATSPLLEIADLQGSEIVYSHDKPYYRRCHYHITMVNGIDAQHLQTVHHLPVKMAVTITEPQQDHLQIVMAGDFLAINQRSKWLIKLLGKRYAYRMTYAHGSLGALTMMQEVKLFDRWPLPGLHMLYAYTPLPDGRSKVTPIYLTKKRKGLMGKLINHTLLFLTKRLFYSLKEEDGMIYENIRFKTDAFLKIDQPIAKFVAFINRQKPSKWSVG